MTDTETSQLMQSLQDVTLNGLNLLIAHHVKGAELIKQGVLQTLNVVEHGQAWWEELKAILALIKPLFELAREWLVSAYNHLVSLWDWAKEMWHKIFG